MRKLSWVMSLNELLSLRADLVPALFTKHQFHLLEKKLSKKELTPTERSEFSRSISKKMKAIYAVLKKENESIFAYGKERIKPERLKTATRYLTQFSRQFKNRHVLITGSFLYNERYNDIDVFVISKYDKEDYVQGKFHINYFTEDVYGSLFFASVQQVCLSNRRIPPHKITEKVNMDTFISLYQELFNDVDRNFAGVKKTIREFLLQAAHLSYYPVPDSPQLHNMTQKICQSTKAKELIKDIFIQAMVFGVEKKEAVSAMKTMISSYHGLMKEYKKHRNYYKDLMSAFQRVMTLAG